MFPIELFDEIFDDVKSRRENYDFGKFSWYEIRQLTLAYTVRKFHLLEESGQSLADFVRGIIVRQVLARMSYEKNKTSIPKKLKIGKQ